LKENAGALDYLCVEPFIDGIVNARALATALEMGVIDFITSNPNCTRESLKNRFRCDSRGLDFVVDLLNAGQVTVEECATLRLTAEFEKALNFRDLLEAKLAFANSALYDFSQLFTTLVASPDQFVRKARIFDFFGYNRCSGQNGSAYELTKRWLGITTVLTKYEARGCMENHDFRPYRRILDVGGNSGEFALRLCREYPDIHATVFDLPVVCDLGQDHVRPEPEAGRIEFIKGNALHDEFPAGFDLVCFKSMLHDWPDKEACGFLAKASRALRPGGTVLVFERGPIQVGAGNRGYSMIPMFLFFRSFRSPELYSDHMKTLGFQDIQIQPVDLEMRFFVLTGTLP
jgi:ubiquinone/menaquinone biosynthesis C-methylase UbiE